MSNLGLLVNPIAGMGGAVGLKGTDGVETLKKAVERGAEPVSGVRASQFLEHLKSLLTKFDLTVAPGAMGEDVARSAQLKHSVLGRIDHPTSAKDTLAIAKMMRQQKVDLLSFCGGDGTARDVMKAVSTDIPVLGIPSGVKMYSSVFAVNPRAAAQTASEFLDGKLPTTNGEVLDVDEAGYRDNRLFVKLEGYVRTPEAEALMQWSKSTSYGDEALEIDAMARYIKEDSDPNTVYVLGPGTTVESIARKFGLKKTLLGVDVMKGDGTVLGLDVNESELIQWAKAPVKIIISPIGGQGFLFGRGNQQISPRVIREVGVKNLIIVATPGKVKGLHDRRLLVDTGDEELDSALKGYHRVVTSYREELVVKIE